MRVAASDAETRLAMLSYGIHAEMIANFFIWLRNALGVN